MIPKGSRNIFLFDDIPEDLMILKYHLRFGKLYGLVSTNIFDRVLVLSLVFIFNIVCVILHFSGYFHITEGYVMDFHSICTSMLCTLIRMTIMNVSLKPNLEAIAEITKQ